MEEIKEWLKQPNSSVEELMYYSMEEIKEWLKQHGLILGLVSRL